MAICNLLCLRFATSGHQKFCSRTTVCFDVDVGFYLSVFPWLGHHAFVGDCGIVKGVEFRAIAEGRILDERK